MTTAKTLSEVEQKHYDPLAVFKEQWKKWTMSTTFHGISCVFDDDRNLFRRVLWFIVIGVMWYMLVSGCYSLVVRYRSYRTLTQDTIQYHADLQIPAVTICSLNIIDNDRIQDERDRAILKGLYLEAPNKTKLLEYPGEAYLKNVSLRRLFVDAAMSTNDTITYCAGPWNNSLVKCSLVGLSTGEGYCHTVKLDQPLPGTNALGAWTSAHSVGIALLMRTLQNKYFISYNAAAGFKVMIHPPGVSPDVRKAVVLGPGFAHFLALQKHEYSYLPSPVKAFGEAECKPLEQLPAGYSMYGCVGRCRSARIYETCGCIGPSDIGDIRVCSPLEIIDCYNTAAGQFVIGSESELCDCALPCQLTDYKTTLTSTHFPSSYSSGWWRNSSDPDDYRQLREDYLQLNIFYENKIVTHHAQVLAFSIDDLSSSIGGYLGLLIGASVISVFELFELVVVSVFRCFLPTQTH